MAEEIRRVKYTRTHKLQFTQINFPAWIITKLSSERPNTIREVMERLSNVPIVPPLESLRHMGLVLANENQNLVPFVGTILNDFPISN